jgi:dihydrofolate synthase/folylpolyglutamate synthase
MSYQSAIDELNAMVPELHSRPGHARRKFSLDEIGVLLGGLGDPHRRFGSVLIAGTNGKGSTAATLASILRASGVRTGLYTSPHLERPNERIEVDGREIADEDFARLFFQVQAAARDLGANGTLAQMPSFFETLTAMAFLHFAAEGIEMAVLEVGMGGRLDATNIVDPMLSIVTDISLDHTEWLGSTIAAIAREKAGILRAGGTLITLPQHPEANQVLGEVATELEVRGVSAVAYMPPMDMPSVEAPAVGLAATSGPAAAPYRVEALGAVIEVASPLRGAHQHRNVALAIAAAVELAEHHGIPITAATIAEGIHETRWPGRLERIAVQDPATGHTTECILDVAHNPAGAWALRAGLREILEEARAGTLIFSCLRDKPAAEMAQILFPLFARVIFAPIASPRATPVSDLLVAAEATGTPAEAAGSVSEALQSARSGAAGGVVVISGSVYLVGAARTLLLAGLKQPVGAGA